VDAGDSLEATKEAQVSEQDRDSKPEREPDALSEEELDKVSGGAGVTKSPNLTKPTLKASKIANPIINVGMEKNDAEELPGAATKTLK